MSDAKLAFLNDAGGNALEVPACCTCFLVVIFTRSWPGPHHENSVLSTSSLCAQVIKDWPKHHADVDLDFVGKLLVHEVGFLLRRLMAEASWVFDLDNRIGLWQTCALNGANDSTSVPWLVAMLCPIHGSANS